jgi:hemolysin activation/secretion protein
LSRTTANNDLSQRADTVWLSRAHFALRAVLLGVLPLLPCVAGAAGPTPALGEAAPAAGPQRMYIREIRVRGSSLLGAPEVQETVYPYLGPGRTPEDVEQARAALEKAYQDKGYQTARVSIPPQQARRGVIYLQVEETKVGRVRVNGARYYLPSEIKRKAPSLAEGTVPDFHRVTTDIVALNRQADLRVTPVLRAGAEPGTVDIDLNVEDKPPLHGSLELNNRYSPSTTQLRLNGAISYANMWQAGHTLGFGFQLAPERLSDAEVFSGYYIAPVPSVDNLSLMLQATRQDSDISTLGGASVAGRGYVVGMRGLVTLPGTKNFSQSFSAGIDYKHFDENISTVGGNIATPIDYYPFSLNYGAFWSGSGITELNASLNFHLRGMGSSQTVFDNKRTQSDGSFFYLRSDLSHTHDLPEGLQVFAKIQGQASDQPLVNSEQLGGGGLGTVRGYPEATALGDNGVFGTIELRSPNLIGKQGDKANEWRFHAFVDAGVLTLNSPLVGQQSRFGLASFGLGSRFRFDNHFNGSLDAGVPLIGQAPVNPHEISVTFRGWADF